MDAAHLTALTIFIFAVATLYSSVGHAGASGYLAAMALFGLAPMVMKPTALVLNILVATITTLRFSRAGCFSWSTFWPFAVTSIPCAFLAGAMTLPVSLYKPAVALVLLCAAIRLFWSRLLGLKAQRSIYVPFALLFGAVIGLLAGATGTGGGIFLSPLLLLMGWAEFRQASGIVAAFILANSIAGLVGNVSSVGYLPQWLPLWIAVVILGAMLGSKLGISKLPVRALQCMLGLVLVLAALKLILT